MANLGEKLGKLSLAILENFVESKLGKKFVDELREPTDRAIAVTTALEQTENVFRGGYDDKEVSKALFEDLEQKDRPALQEAVGKYYDHPTDPSLRQALREILFDEFKDVLSKERIDKAVDHYIKTLTKELIQTDDGFRDNIAALATYEGSLADQRSAQYLEQIAAWTIQHQIASSMPPETHDSIGYIPSARVVTYIERGKIEDDVRTFLQDGGTGAIVGLHAPGGLGKTELAKHTAEELKDQFEGVLWVDVGDHKPEQVIADILTKFGVQMPPNSTYEQQVNELRHAFENRRLLVVFDDLREDALDGLQDFMPPKPNSTLITSRI
ncbi:MAG TPA: NB-ARC domain-containing protein, partial [Anaerolineales bacterium]|nr:NB-ARC domain-containing protein [Anaerolineales bacterium]